MLLRLSLLMTLCFCYAQAVLNGKELKRREAGFDSYGPPPPRPAPQYGPPPQHHHIPHREYGVPQQIPFREYGPPALKYGPPKLNFLGGGGGGHGGGGGGGGVGLYEQIKTHFGVPKPFYGPPHIQHKPSHEYGPPPSQKYGPPPPQYGPPPQQNYGPPPLKLQHRPQPQYGPPPQQQKPHFPQPLPAPHPAQLFKPAHQPATSYGPPASGPLNLPPKPVYDTPPNYGPPPLPVNLPGPQPANFNRAPETTIILTGPSGQQPPSGHGGSGPFKQVQIQIDASGHTHSVSGSQAPFHTACDGWKPIPAPIGAYIEQNHIETQGGYSNVDQGHHSQSFGNQYSVGGGFSTGSGGGGGSIIDGLTDEQLVAVALQSEAGNLITGPGGSDPHLNNNNIDSDALQISVGSIGDTYSKPPSDSFAPGSVHANKYQTIGNAIGLPPPPHAQPGPNYGAPPLPPPPHFAALTSNHAQSQSQSHSQSHSNVNIQYGPPPSGNPPPFPRPGAGHPNKPVAYRPPVPNGLLESIGATVQHLDQFGVKPAQQPPTYIPPAAHEIALSGPSNAPQAIYGTPLNQQQAPPPQIIVQQQLPQPQPGPTFVHQKQPQQLQQYGPPGPLPQPQPNYLPPGPPQQQQQQYLPPRPALNFHYEQQQQQQQHHQQQQHSENSFSSSQYTQQFVHSQGLPLAQQAPRFNQQPPQHQAYPQQPQQQTVVVHDCGHGPNLVSSNGYQVQHQQQQQQQYQQQQQQQQHFGSISASSPGAYNAIAQSIPVAEQHTQFLTGPADSYGPPPSGNEIDFDHTGYASQKTAVAALPDGTDPNELPGLDGLNVISAQKSQSIQLTSGSDQPTQNFQVQFGSSLNNVGTGGNHNNNVALGEAVANHEEILSQGLLQSILTAIEQPQPSSSLPQNHKAQSRSDDPHHEDQKEQQLQPVNDDENEGVEEQHHDESNRVEVRVLSDADVNEKGKEHIQPIVAAEVEEIEAEH